MSKRLDPRYRPLRGLLATVWGCDVQVNKRVGGRMYPLVVSLPKMTAKRVLIRAWPECNMDGYMEWKQPNGDVLIEASFNFLLSANAELLVVRKFRGFNLCVSKRVARMMRSENG